MLPRGGHRPDLRNPADLRKPATGPGNTGRRWEFVAGRGGRSGPGISDRRRAERRPGHRGTPSDELQQHHRTDQMRAHEQPPTGSRPNETRILAWQKQVQRSDIMPITALPNTRWISEDQEYWNEKKDSIQKDIQKEKEIINNKEKELDEISKKIDMDDKYNKAREKLKKLRSQKKYIDMYINAIKSQEGTMTDEGLKRTYRIRKSYIRGIEQQAITMMTNDWRRKEQNAPGFFELEKQRKQLQDALNSAKSELSASERELADVKYNIQEIADIVQKIAEIQQREQRV
jgi:hypothetical protein